MMKIAVLVFILISVARTSQFDQYLINFNKSYPDTAQYQQRQNIFLNNLAYYTFFNNLNHSYSLAVNNFSDWTEEQYAQSTRHPPNDQYFQQSDLPTSKRLLMELPSLLDWRNKNAVAAVKNQGQCSSCWAFATTAVVESFMMVNTGNYSSFSEEYVLECTPGGSCNGFNIQTGLKFVLNSGGMPTTSTQPYMGSFYPGSAFSISRPGICTNSQIVRLPNNTQLKVYYNLTYYGMKLLLQNGPVVAYMYSPTDFKSYSNGTYFCATTPSVSQLNRHVLIVGYDDNGTLIIKNDWGTSWGMNGYALINSTLNCGMFMKVFQMTNSFQMVLVLSLLVWLTLVH